MNCGLLSQLLDETPLPRWTPEQRSSAEEHCLSCITCKTLMRRQEDLFIAFEEMSLIQPTNEFTLEEEAMADLNKSSSSVFTRFFPVGAVLFLCFGSVFQLIMDERISVHLFADGSRLESLINLVYSGAGLPVALTLVGLVYALSREKVDRAGW